MRLQGVWRRSHTVCGCACDHDICCLQPQAKPAVEMWTCSVQDEPFVRSAVLEYHAHDRKIVASQLFLRESQNGPCV